MGDDEHDWLRDPDAEVAEIAEKYDDWAPTYDEELAGWDYRAPVGVASVLAAAGPPRGRVLDVGCGTGLSGRALRTVGFDHLVGVDLSPASLEIAAASGVYEAVREVDLTSSPIPFDDDSFTALTCVGVLTYVPDTGAVVREFCRVVEPGGHIVFTQREDVWDDRGDRRTLDALAADGRCEIAEISGPLPYVPGSEDIGDLGMMLVHLRSGASA